MKKVLVVHYSQTGQLTSIVQAMLAPLRGAVGVEVHEAVLKPVVPYPFPWPFFSFLDVFPESVRLDPAPIQTLGLPPDEHYDLVVLAYQVWYLSPSAPITAFLAGAEGRRLLQGRPVVTVVACRNMWLMAQETMKRLLAEVGAKHTDHVAFVDRAPVLATLITTPRWLLTGRREGFWGLPRAGVRAEDVAGAARFGKALAEALGEGRETRGEPMLRGLRAAVVDPALLMSERAGHRAFRAWSGLVRACGKPGQWQRRPVLLLFLAYLVLMILTVVPLSLLLRKVFAPLLRARLAVAKAAHELPSGSGEERLAEYR
ncbi:MAG: dialkylresorcinol condensing enzyme [Burkholderiales bacterium]|nr:MAG: dialkylresorcinol condensing enzyme [Burkholderiales bacterium]